MYTKNFYKLSDTKINLNDEFSDTSTFYGEEDRNLAYKNFYEACAIACMDTENQYEAIQLIEYNEYFVNMVENKIFDKRQLNSFEATIGEEL